MARAFVFIDVATGASASVCESVREVEGVAEASVVVGDFDVVAELEGEGPHDLLSTITSAVRPLDDVGATRTYVCLD